MEDAISFSKKYLEDLLSFFGLNVDVYATHEDDVIELSVPSTHLNGFLIGHNGDTMRALQFMVLNAVRNLGHDVRVNVDIADYKKARNERLAEQAKDWCLSVKNSGKPYELKPMNPAERRVVHQVAGEYGLITESVGYGRDRHVIIKQDDSSADTEAE